MEVLQAAQIRAARALLAWRQEELAKAAKIGLATLARIEQRARNMVERFFYKDKQCRRVATRYDRLAANPLAFIKLASIRIWLRAYEFAPAALRETKPVKNLAVWPYLRAAPSIRRPSFGEHEGRALVQHQTSKSFM